MRYALLMLMLIAILALATPHASRAATADDTANVRAVARSFIAALFDRDLARAERLASAGGGERDVIEGMALSLSSEAKLALALDREFGAGDDNDPCTPANILRLLTRTDGQVDSAPAEVGDPAATTLPMRRAGDRWKVDVIELARRRKVGDGFLARARQRAADVERLIADLDAGLYASAADVRAAAAAAARDQATAAVETSDVITDE